MAGMYPIGAQVVGSDGVAGTLEDVLNDAQGSPRYLVVRDKGFFGKDVVLPTSDVSVDGATVRVAMTRAAVHAAPSYDHAQHGAAAGLYSSVAAGYDAAREQEKG